MLSVFSKSSNEEVGIISAESQGMKSTLRAGVEVFLGEGGFSFQGHIQFTQHVKLAMQDGNLCSAGNLTLSMLI